jgi:CRP-like cAMP-binding protein
VTRRLPPDAAPDRKPPAAPPGAGNRILARLQRDDRERLTGLAELKNFASGHVFYRNGDAIDTVYFPETAVASCTLTMEDGRTAEVGTIGTESAVGLTAWQGPRTSPVAVICQIAGTGHALPLEALARAAAESPGVRDALVRAVHALSIQTMHSVVCNALHSLEERLARWLLMTHDRVRADELRITQQFLAYMLGVYRPSVTVVARTFQAAGFIRYERGSVTIVDREGLEAAACECYHAYRSAVDALFAAGDPPAGSRR